MMPEANQPLYDIVTNLQAELTAHKAETAALRDQLAAQATELARLKNATSTPVAESFPAPNSIPDSRPSRRRLLKKLAVSAAGLAAAGTALAASSSTASANSGSNSNIGLYAYPGSAAVTGLPTAGAIGLAGSDTNDLGSPGVPTAGVYGYSSTGGNGVFGVGFNGVYGRAISGGGGGSGVRGVSMDARGVDGAGVIGVYGYGSSQGVYGFSILEGVYGEGGIGVTGRGYGDSSIGLLGDGKRAPLLLQPALTAGAPTSLFHTIGELYVDSAGVLYTCVVAGTPGTWRIANPTIAAGAKISVTATTTGYSIGSTALNFNLLATPDRYLDTRSFVGTGDPTGEIPAGTSQTYQITGRAGQGGAAAIPSTAKAIFGNLTAVPGAGISGSGFLKIYAAGSALPTVANVNYGATLPVGNSFICALPANGKVSIYALKNAHAILDIFGYYD